MNRNKQRKKIKEIIREIKFKATQWMGIHKYAVGIVLVIIILIFPYILLGIIRGADFLPFPFYTRLDDGVNVWFSFWGSYLPTVLLGLAAMYAADKYDRVNREKTDVQIAMGFKDLNVQGFTVYDLDKYYPADLMELLQVDLSDSIKYLFKIEFSDVYFPYFSVRLKRFCWFNSISKDSVSWEVPVEQALTENHDRLILYVPISRQSCGELLEDIHKYYFINYFEPSVLPHSERTKKVVIELESENKLFDSNNERVHTHYGVFRLKIELTIENQDTYAEPFVQFTVRDRLLGMKQGD